MPQKPLDTIKGFMRNPYVLLVKNHELTLDGIAQYYLNVEEGEHKINALVELFPFIDASRGIIFCKTRLRTQELTRDLLNRKLTINGMVR